MPLYEYHCDRCGIFDRMRPLAESDLPAHCPTCQESAKRIFSPPMILSETLRLKRENPEPTLVKRPEREPEKPKARSHTGSCPWMIGH